MDAFKQKNKLVFVSYGSRELGNNRGGDPKAATEELRQSGVNSVFYVSPGHGPRMAILAAQPARVCAAGVQRINCHSARCRACRRGSGNHRGLEDGV